MSVLYLFSLMGYVSLNDPHMRDNYINSVAYYLLTYLQNQMIIVKQKFSSSTLNICDGNQLIHSFIPSFIHPFIHPSIK